MNTGAQSVSHAQIINFRLHSVLVVMLSEANDSLLSGHQLTRVLGSLGGQKVCVFVFYHALYVGLFFISTLTQIPKDAIDMTEPIPGFTATEQFLDGLKADTSDPVRAFQIVHAILVH